MWVRSWLSIQLYLKGMLGTGTIWRTLARMPSEDTAQPEKVSVLPKEKGVMI
jgi:hypothetical protein